MNLKNLILLTIALGMLIAAGVIAARNLGPTGPSSESPDQLLAFTCASCGNEFESSKRDLANARAEGGPIPCPECGKRTTRMAHKCPSCGRNIDLVGHGALPPACPHCNHRFGNYDKAFNREAEMHDTLNNENLGDN